MVNSRACPSEENGETENGVGWLGFIVGYPEEEFEDGQGGDLDVEKWWLLEQDMDDFAEARAVGGWGGGNGLFMTFGC